MKKIITLFSFMLCVAVSFGQYTIANHSFENWSPNGSGMWPDQWEAYDSSSTAMFGLLERRTGGTEGTYSLRMNCYQDGSFVTGAWLEKEDTIPFAPEAFTLDYIIPPGGSFLSSIRINLYFYDSAGEFIYGPSIDFTTTSNSFKAGVLPLHFDSTDHPKSYAMDIKFQNVTGDPSEYVIVDNVRFLEDYTPPTTGVNEVEMQKLSVYPNPVKDILYINDLPANSGSIRITGMDGREIQQSNLTFMSNSVQLVPAPSGIYLMELVDKTGNTIRRTRISRVN